MLEVCDTELRPSDKKEVFILKKRVIGLLLAVSFILSMTTFVIATDNDDPYGPVTAVKMSIGR